LSEEELTAQTSLKEFVTENYRLLTVLSVLFAVLGLFQRGDQTSLTRVLSVMICVMAVTVLYELLKQLPGIERAEYTFLVFLLSLILLMVMFVFWIIEVYQEELVTLALLLGSFILYAIIIKLWKKYTLTTKIKQWIRRS
jgi:hypothetical protein